MLSDREKRWVQGGGILILYILYLWLVLFPLIGFHKKMSRRIDRSWGVMRKLEAEIKRYAQVALPVRNLVRRASLADQKATAKEQLRLLAGQVLGQQEGVSLNFETVWEGDRVGLCRCLLKGKASSDQIIKLIQRVDHHYHPMRVGSWHLKHVRGGTGDLSMEIYYLEAAER